VGHGKQLYFVGPFEMCVDDTVTDSDSNCIMREYGDKIYQV
jgi:hypothetical protein